MSVDNYRKGWNNIFGKQTEEVESKSKQVKTKKIDDGYGEKPYDELEPTE